MHFWINKPAGRYRVPATPLPKVRSGHRERGREVDRPMVTPVHRFQSLNSAASHAPGPSNSCNYGSRHLRPALRNVDAVGANNNSENISLQLVQQPAGNASNAVSCDGTETVGNDQVHSTPSTAADATPSRGLLDFSDFTDAELAGYRLRCGVWITFVLAAGFVVAAKFYFDHQGTGLEVLVYCGLLVTLLLSGCFYSILCRRTDDNATVRDNVLQSQDDPIAALTAANTIANESIGLPAVVPTVGQNPPPPPYHIAILIPSSESAEEIPPPSYDKVTITGIYVV